MDDRSVRSIRFVAAEQPVDLLVQVQSVGFSTPDGSPPDPALAAKEYLARVLLLDAADRVSFDGTTPEVAETAVTGVQASKLTDTSVVRFAEERQSIPVFGSHVTVEVAADGALVAVDADLSVGLSVSPTPTIDPAAALAAVARHAGADPATLTVGAPTLTFFQDDPDDDGVPDAWHLAWHFKNVPATPADDHGHVREQGRGHGCSSRARLAPFHYLVDAHDGRVLFHYSATPRARRDDVPAMPVVCRGIDEAGVRQEFHGRAVDGGFELHDPMRGVSTFDMAGANISALRPRLPKNPIRSATADFGDGHRAAISAHVNVGRVLDFYRSVLMRDSVDDRGMAIVSIVNCTSEEDEPPPNWTNAFWYEDRMWYGQVPDRQGRLRSLSNALDIVAHELTHGVIERTSNLVYKRDSGALNESFADIFGVIIANWYLVGPDAVDRWNWDVGAELWDDFKPMRDFSDPTRMGDPDHMKNYLKTRDDDGGVHTNSNIHNKAAYFLLTAKEADGSPSLSTREVAVLYYLCLVRLPQRATFPRALRGLLDAGRSYFAGDVAVRDRKLKAIEKAYKKVGITAEE